MKKIKASSKVNFLDLILIFFLLFCSLAIFGFHPLEGNNVLYYPYLLKLQNPLLFSQDILFDAFKYHLSIFYELIILISNVFKIDLVTIFTLLSLLTFSAIAFFSFLISQAIFNNKKISYLFLIFLMAPKYSLAYEAIGINLDQATQTTVAIAMALGAIYLFLNQRHILVFFILGLAANIQPIITFQLLLVLSFSQIINLRHHFSLADLKMLIVEYLITFFGSLPIIISVFILKNRSLMSTNWFSYAPEWFEIVKLRIAHHFLPSRWGLICWCTAFIFLSFFYIVIRHRHQTSTMSSKDKIIINIMFGFIPVFFLGYIGELIPIPIILLVEIFRVYVFFDFFCILYGTYFIYVLLTAKSSIKKIIGLCLAYFMFLPTSIIYNFNPFKPMIIGPFALLLVFIFIILIDKYHPLNKKFKLHLIIFLLLIFFSISAIRRLYLNYQYWGYLTLDNSQNRYWKDVQIWAKNNTSIDALFIIPPNLYGFRVYSQRPIVGSFKDGASLLFHPYLYQKWGEIMGDLGVKKEMAKGAFLFGYKEIKDEIIIKNLAEKYRADYLVSNYNDLNLPKVYNNNQFAVYKLNSQ